MVSSSYVPPWFHELTPSAFLHVIPLIPIKWLGIMPEFPMYLFDSERFVLYNKLFIMELLDLCLY